MCVSIYYVMYRLNLPSSEFIGCSKSVMEPTSCFYHLDVSNGTNFPFLSSWCYPSFLLIGLLNLQINIYNIHFKINNIHTYIQVLFCELLVCSMSYWFIQLLLVHLSYFTSIGILLYMYRRSPSLGILPFLLFFPGDSLST